LQRRPNVSSRVCRWGGNLRSGISKEPFPGQWEKSLEIFVKGYESPAPEPLLDNDGTLRGQVLTEWWRQEYSEVTKDKRIVFGHYWNIPPIPGKHESFVPPFPSGHPELRAWFADHHRDAAPSGRTKVPEETETACIDFNGVTRAGERACIGAYRYPEAEVVWST
jgi:hypothetical protein